MEDFFTRCDGWLTGIASLDAQHVGLANCIREIEELCCSKENIPSEDSPTRKQRLCVLLDRLYQATKEHFKCEEAAMLEVDYPEQAAHSREHMMMLAELKLIIRDHESGNCEVDEEVARGLKVGFIAHIQLSDCKFSSFAATHRLVLE